MDLLRACENAIESGVAEKLSDTAIFFTGNVDLHKLDNVRRSYAAAFHKRWQERVTKEQEAEKRLHDFVLTY